MTIQIAVKLEDGAVASLDRLVADGAFSNRSQAVRSAVDALVRGDKRGRIDAAYAEGFRRHPETDDEMDEARRRAVASIEEEPWSDGGSSGRDLVGEAPDEKGRPYLVVSRDGANRVMRRVLVAPVTSTRRGVPSELVLDGDEGLPQTSVATFDNLTPFPKATLVRRLGALSPMRRHELCTIAAATLDC